MNLMCAIGMDIYFFFYLLNGGSTDFKKRKPAAKFTDIKDPNSPTEQNDRYNPKIQTIL